MARNSNLTALMVEKAKPRPGQRYELLDAGKGSAPGFALRVSETGVKSYVVRVRVDGRQRRLTIGSATPGMAGYLTLAEARAKAHELRGKAKQGIDPSPTKAKAKAEDAQAEAERERNSVEAAVAGYITRYLRKNTRRWRDAEGMLRRDVVPAWGTRPLAAVTKRDVQDLIDGIGDRGSPVAANRTLSLLQRFLGWAVERGIIETNVAAGLKRPNKEKPRERALSEAEVRAVWSAFETMAYPFGKLGQLLLLTGQRRGEIAGLRWADLDLKTGVLHLDGTATKTGTEHEVPLSHAVLEILRDLPRIDDSPLVFPATRADSTHPISGFSKALLVAHRLSGTSGWHWHDLRRTAATHMARIEVPPHICERILNHSAGSTMTMIARTYNRHTYAKEMRGALEKWAVELQRIMTGEPAKVVEFPRQSSA